MLECLLIGACAHPETDCYAEMKYSCCCLAYVLPSQWSVLTDPVATNLSCSLVLDAMHLLTLEHANQPQSLKKQSVDRQVKSDVTNSLY